MSDSVCHAAQVGPVVGERSVYTHEPLASVAYLSLMFQVSHRYAMWTLSFESITIDGVQPREYDESNDVVTQDPDLFVVYSKSMPRLS